MDSKNINNNGNNDSNKQPQLGCVKWVAKNINNNKNKTTSTGMCEMGSQKHQQLQLQQTTSTGKCQMDGKNIDNNSNNNGAS